MTRRFPGPIAAVLAMLGAALIPVGAGTAGATTTATQPTRVLDTRTGLGAAGPVQPGTVVTLPIKAAAGATSVVLNLTATEASGPGWVRVWPCGTAEPSTSA